MEPTEVSPLPRLVFILTTGFLLASLSKASKEYNPLVVLKRLNLARNYQSTVYSKDIMNDDMNWMKNQYKKYKKKHGMN